MLIDTSTYINLSIKLKYKDILKRNNFNLDLIDQASEIIDSGKSALVYKTTRAGLTTSSIAAAKLLGKKVLILEPNHGIRENTINKVPEIAHKSILPNKKCLRLQKKFIEDPDLEKLFYSLPNCEECSLYDNCEVTEFLRSSDYDVVSMTYKKLEALVLSKSKITNKIFDKLNTDIDLIIFDEAHILNYQDTIKINYQFNPSDVFKTKDTLRIICNSWQSLKDDILDLNPWSEESNLDILEQRLSKGKSSQNLALQVYQPVYLKPETLKYAQKELLELAENRYNLNLSFDEIERFRDLINFFNNNVGIFIIQIVGDETLISGIGYNYVQEFIKKVPKQVLITSATLYEKNKGFFGQMVGSDLEEITFQDLRRTDDKVKIIPSKYKMDYRDERVFENLIRNAKEILDKEKDIYLVAMNSRTAKEIQLRLNRDGYPVKVDYYRSTSSLGVENENRVCIAFGLAEVPVNTFDADCINSHNPLVESRRLRYDYVLSSTWQAWSRVKDPTGISESKIYAIGVRSSDCQNVIRWGKGRTASEIRTIKKLPDKEVESFKFKVEVKEPVGLPTIEFESRSKEHMKPHKLSPSNFIDTFLTPYKHLAYQQNLELARKSPRYYTALSFDEMPDSDVEMVLWNFPKSEEEINWNYTVMNNLFCHRRTPIAIQNENGSYHPDKKVHLDKDAGVIIDHLNGDLTMGIYPIKADGTVTAFCWDIDRHKPEDPPTEPILRSLLSVLDQYGIEYLIEGSGSPDSYHIWAFCYPANAITVNKFGTVIMNEARVKCEFFPPQKRLGRDKPLGNLIKLPLGINRKNGNRSRFLGVETLKPIEGKIKLPKIIKFNQISDDKLTEEKVKFFMKYENHKMRPCFSEALNKGLSFTGYGGHRFRLALAIEAYHSGLEVEEIIKLFEPQADFDEEKTRYQIEHAINSGYRPFTCATLQTDCAEFTSCVTCKFCKG